MSATDKQKKISILGSTGSIGRSALEVVRLYPDLFRVEVLAAHANMDLLEAQVREFKPAFVAVTDAEAGRTLRERMPGVELAVGAEHLIEAAQRPVDTVLCAVVGAVGLRPLLAAIDGGNRVAVANKEPFVMAGGLILQHAKEKGVQVLPVDSEHSAIFQCLLGSRIEDVLALHLTASGGPFYRTPREQLSTVTPEQACKHPTWDMGAKISVDSATLMNKGLEIIEAMWLFGIPEERIQVVIHPQSIVHSVVEFRDGNMLAHLGVTDMKFPILFALNYPERVEYPIARLDLTALGALNFAAPDFEAFPCLSLAREAARAGGTAPAVLNAANEEAVAAFCRRELPFLGISEVVAATVGEIATVEARDLDTVLHADMMARESARKHILNIGNH